jgi:hypothetical protein
VASQHLSATMCQDGPALTRRPRGACLTEMALPGFQGWV